jgi:hypothetical protein
MSYRRKRGRGSMPCLRPTWLGPAQWQATPPLYYWAPKAQFQQSPDQHTPELGRAFYNPRGVGGDPNKLMATMRSIVQELTKTPNIVEHIRGAFEHYALKERVWAAREGHTAIRKSELLKIASGGVPVLGDGAEQLLVLRGKRTPTQEEAVELLAGLGVSLEPPERKYWPDAFTMRERDFYALAGMPNSEDDADELVYMPVMPTSAEEAKRLVDIGMTIFTDTTKWVPGMDAKAAIKICIGFTSKELQQGGSAVIVW